MSSAISAGREPIGVVPTGGGKTVIFSRLLAEYDAPSIALAHRKELIAQISRGLASEGIVHQIIAPPPTIRMIATNNATSFGRSYISTGAAAAVGSVDSLKNTDPRWAATKRLVLFDEAHHCREGNKWGRARDIFHKATTCGWTATCERGDGQGLGKHAGGLFDEIVQGPTMRELISRGHLTDYRIYADRSTQLDLSKIAVSKKTGDFSSNQMRQAMADSQITGSVVEHYKRLAPGKLGLTFVADVARAEETAAAYRAAGVPAAVLSAKSKPLERAQAIRDFADRKLLQLVNVDLLFEGFDLAAAAGRDVCVEAISIVRPTHSFVVYAQMFGRVLRLGPGKSHGIVIDHVGNVLRHMGPPDMPRPITLDAKPRRSSQTDKDVPPVRQCGECGAVYQKELGGCPYCGEAWSPAQRSQPSEVDGDLTELDPKVLADLRQKAEKLMQPDDQVRARYAATCIPELGVRANVKRHREAREAQFKLRARIAALSGEWRAEGLNDSAIYVRFYVRYGIDVATACTLKLKEAESLLEKMQ